MIEIEKIRPSRRTVVAGVAAAGTLAAVGIATSEGVVPLGADGPGAALFGSRATAPLMAGEIDLWQTAIGDSFGIASTSMRLIGVEPLASPGARPAGLRRRGFIAVFELSAFAQLPGNLIYTISSAGHGTFDLYLVEGTGRFANRLKAVLN